LAQGLLPLMTYGMGKRMAEVFFLAKVPEQMMMEQLTKMSQLG
jgi:hypothetical protein